MQELAAEMFERLAAEGVNVTPFDAVRIDTAARLLARAKASDGAPFLSAPRVVTKVRILPIDPSPNLKRIGDVKCPVLFFHGTEDRVIPYSHGRALFELAREPKRFITIEGGDHNDFPVVMGVDEYLREIRNFADSCGGKEEQI